MVNLYRAMSHAFCFVKSDSQITIQGFIQRGKPRISPPKNLRKFYYYREISTMMYIQIMLTVHDRNKVYRPKTTLDVFDQLINKRDQQCCAKTVKSGSHGSTAPSCYTNRSTNSYSDSRPSTVDSTSEYQSASSSLRAFSWSKVLSRITFNLEKSVAFLCIKQLKVATRLRISLKIMTVATPSKLDKMD